MTRVMNRAALLLIATITGLGALYTIYLSLTGDDGFTAWQALRALAAVVVVGAAMVTWAKVVRPTPDQTRTLKRTALAILVIGIVGLGANALVGARTNNPDGPVFALSLLLILQAFLTIAHAARQT